MPTVFIHDLFASICSHFSGIGCLLIVMMIFQVRSLSTCLLHMKEKYCKLCPLWLQVGMNSSLYVNQNTNFIFSLSQHHIPRIRRAKPFSCYLFDSPENMILPPYCSIIIFPHFHCVYEYVLRSYMIIAFSNHILIYSLCYCVLNQFLLFIYIRLRPTLVINDVVVEKKMFP